MQVNVEASWAALLQQEFASPQFSALAQFVKQEYASQRIYPEGKNIFLALDSCPVEKVKVVILGQDPYHGPGQAHGLSFSVPPGVAVPPSLANIFKETEADTGSPAPGHGNLLRWAQQGVLLLNSVLTVRAGSPASHAGQGWEWLTDAAIARLAHQRQHLVFLLWGSYAQRKQALIPPGRHLVLQAPHPSPLSAHRGFLGCRHFSKANAYLVAHGQQPIAW